MVAKKSDTEFFRCELPPERSQAEIRIRRKRLCVRLQEASIDGFTVLVDSRDAGKLQMGMPWLLLHDGSKLEVYPQWLFHAADGRVQIGLRRLRDLTRPPQIGGWRPTLWGTPRASDASSESLWMLGAVLTVLVSLSLPGIGDALGTSGRIQTVIHTVIASLRNLLA